MHQRLQTLANSCRVLWLKLCYGWVTHQQRCRCFDAGYDAVEWSSHLPLNLYTHPLLRQDFEDGADLARDNLRIDDNEAYMRDVEDTYYAILREQMADIREECRELGLVDTTPGTSPSCSRGPIGRPD